jgi:hypothetical protein
MIFSDLASPAETGFAKAGNRFPLSASGFSACEDARRQWRRFSALISVKSALVRYQFFGKLKYHKNDKGTTAPICAAAALVGCFTNALPAGCAGQRVPVHVVPANDEFRVAGTRSCT